MTILLHTYRKFGGMKVFSLLLVLFSAAAARAQVLEPLGNGLPSRVVAAYAAGNEYLALFEEISTPDTTDFTVARWNGAYWSYYPGLIKPAAVKTVDGQYVYNSVVLYRDTMYVGAYITGATRDADEEVSHLYKWSGSNWVSDRSVIRSKNDGIVSMTVFDGKLIVAGKFRNAFNGNMVDNIAAYDGSNGRWSFLGLSNAEQGTDGTIRCLQAIGNRLYIAGDFQYFAGALTGNIAYYTASNGGWGGIGSPFGLRVNELAAYQGKLAALGLNSYGKTEIREFDGIWGAALSMDTFTLARPHTIAGAGGNLIIGGEFLINGNGTSLLRYEQGGLYSTGNRISGQFRLGQRGSEAFIWGGFTEQNTGLRRISKIESTAGDMVGVLYFDKDQNCNFDGSDEALNAVTVRFENMSTGKVWFTVTDSQGRFAAALPEGDYRILPFTGRHWLNPCPGNYASGIRKGQYSFVSLGQFIPPAISDLEIQGGALLPAVVKPGDKVRVSVYVKNNGSTLVNGPTLHLNHDARLIDFESEPAPDNYVAGEATWSLTGFGPRSSRTIVATFTLPADAKATDRFLCQLRTGSLFTSGDAYSTDNFDTIALKTQSSSGAAVIKRSLRGDDVDYRIADLVYHVDFTNTGTSFVKRLVMMDTVDANIPMSRVVVTNLYPTEATVRTEKGNILVVEFPNANLSTLESNPAFCSGFMTYRIELRDELKPDNYVYNRATGDFDSRWKASSNMVAVKANSPSASRGSVQAEFGRISPNPAGDVLNIEFNRFAQGNIELLDLTGRVVFSGYVNGQQQVLHVSAVKPGLYILKTPLGNSRVQISR